MLSFLNPLPQLSKYPGPYKVGSTEFEIPVSEIDSSSPVPDSRITTIKFRVFYPTTSDATSKKSIPWLPQPQKIWNQAYAQFMGISEKRAGWLSRLPSLLGHATIPATQNAPLLGHDNAKQYPVVMFSHGLGGNYNTYSTLLGSMASCGVVCVSPEFRDGSAPISLIKSSGDKIETTIPYERVTHSPSVEVLNARNAMLRVRMWELELLYTAVHKLNEGKSFTNFADTVSQNDKAPTFQNAFDLRPGKVTWMGHSFGSTTTVQFMKSVYWRQHAPGEQTDSSNSEGWNMTPLYTPAIDGELARQITSESPTVLLDLWTMPLRGTSVRWLWERPMPCYDRNSTSAPPNLLSIMSAEFYKWPDLRNRTRAILSADPTKTLASFHQAEPGSEELKSTTESSSSVSKDMFSRTDASKASATEPAEADFQEPVEPELTPVPSRTATDSQLAALNANSEPTTRTPSPAPPPSSTQDQSSSSPSTTTSQSKISTPSPSPAHLYMIPNSAHLSQSDFGPLFPNLTRYFMKAQDPEKTMELNVRAILAVMRGQGLPVGQLDTGNVFADEGHGVDRILDDGVVIDRWVRVPLPASEQDVSEKMGVGRL